MQVLKNFIGGEYCEAVSGQLIDKVNPATGQVISKIPRSDLADVELAVRAAKKAQTAWAESSLEHRFRILERIAAIVESRIDELAMAETNDTGKPLGVSKVVDIPRAAANFRFFAAAATQFASEAHEMPGSAINYTLRQPIGLVACISPWNLPLYLFTWKIAPALAAGNCVVAKPSELSPTSAYLFSQICSEAGLPPGVLNIVHGLGTEAGEAMVSHPCIKAISFTGGTKTGARIAAMAAPEFKKLSLELGGKNPCLVFDDCDYENTLSEVVRLSFSNSGQICLCGSRILIQKSLYETFRDDLVSKTKTLKVGDPLQEGVQIGSVISKAHQEKILSYIELAQKEGGQILCGGNDFKPKGRCENGAFVMPTIIEGLPADCRTNKEEIFGPVITLQPFQDEAEAIQLANTGNYGLASTLWTRDIHRATRLSRSLQTGIVWVNCWLHRDLRTPFGGMNASGVGREGGWEAMRFFTEAKNVCIKY